MQLRHLLLPTQHHVGTAHVHERFGFWVCCSVVVRRETKGLLMFEAATCVDDILCNSQ
jgi:hypothetical protein